MEGKIVKLKNNTTTEYLLPVTSSQAVIMGNNDSLEDELKKYIKKVDLSSLIQEKIILKSPNGSLFEVTVADNGQLVTVPYEMPEEVEAFMRLDVGTLDSSILGNNEVTEEENTYLALGSSNLDKSILG